MDYTFLPKGLINIIFNPEKEWGRIVSENKTTIFLRNNYLFPLILLVSISAIAGSLIFINTELSPVYSLLIGLKSFLLLLITVYASSLIFSHITYPLDLGKDFKTSFRIIVYSITPFLLCEIISSIFESLLFLDILGLFGLYIFWTGAEKILTPPDYKKIPMLIATVVSIIGIYIVSDIILKILTDKIYNSFFI
jgi:hypothetical protein